MVRKRPCPRDAWSGYVSGEMWKGGYYYKASAVHEVGLYCGGS
jgi:hypothetical protein